MVPTINEEFTLRIWNSMLIKLRLQCIGNVCCVLVYSQSVYSTQLCVHTEQWIDNFGLTRSTALYPNPRYSKARYKEGRLYLIISLWRSATDGAYWHGLQSKYAGRNLCLEYLFPAGTTRVSNSCM